VQRAVVHSIVTIGLMGVGALYVWSLRGPWGPAEPLGFFGIAPLVVGGLGLLACVWGGVALGSGRRVPPLALLAAPLACVVLAGLCEVIGVSGALRECIEGNPGVVDSPASGEALTRAIAARGWTALALVCAGLGFIGCALAAGCAPVDREAGEPLRVLRRVTVALAAAGALFAAGWLVQRTVAAWWLIEANGWPAAWSSIRDNLGYALDGDTWPLWMVPAIAVIAAVAVPLALGRRTPRLEEVRTHISKASADASALAAAAIVGSGANLALAVWFGLSARAMQFHLFALSSSRSWKLFPDDPGLRVAGMYGGSAVAAVALAVVALLVAAPLLLAMRHRTLRMAAPLVAVLIAVAPLVVARIPVTLAADRALGPYCEQRCNELDRSHAALTLRPWQTNDRMDHDRRCWGMIHVEESPELRLPRVEARSCPEVGVTLSIKRDQILVHAIEHAQLTNGRFHADALSGGRLHVDLYDAISYQAEVWQALAERSPANPFHGTYLVIADADTPMVTVDIVRHTAREAGFDDPQFVVALPERHDTPWLRIVRVDPKHPSEGIWRLQGEEWTLLIDLDGARLVSPDGAVDIVAHQPEELATRARPHVVARGAPTTIVNVTHHPDVTLQEELRYRAALTQDRLFSVAYTADPPALPVESPAKPDQPPTLPDQPPALPGQSTP